MNIKHSSLSGLFLLFLILAALPAGAVSPYGDGYVMYINRAYSAGYSYRDLSPSHNTFCYLSHFTVAETDTAAEDASCSVDRGEYNWYLTAFLGRSSDARVQCGARCYNN